MIAILPIFIILIILLIAIFFTYTCTDGTWDFDNFKRENCKNLPDEKGNQDLSPSSSPSSSSSSS